MFPEFREAVHNLNPVGPDSPNQILAEMKLIKFANLVALGLVLILTAPGCRHKPEGMTGIPKGQMGNPKDIENAKPIERTEAKGTDTNGIPQVDPDKFKDYVPHPDILAADTAYFDFDSSVVKSSEDSKVAAVAEYMKANTANALSVEGHCDERGTEEYNRALGERRALALREALVTKGVDAGRILTKTFGKDRPAVQGHDEAAWSKNRRGEFVVLTPPSK
jgi:peptidoglycan-associated lipoprotein